MSSADELLAKVEEVAKHPKALLFGALAAECRTPTETASEAKEKYGLSNQEEKLAKRVAVLKRDSQTLFGKSYLEVLAEVTKKMEEKEMEVQVIEGAIDTLEWLVNSLEKNFSDLSIEVCRDDHSGVLPLDIFKSAEEKEKLVWKAYSFVMRDAHQAVPVRISTERARILEGDIASDLSIVVKSEKYLSNTQNFAQEYQKLTGRRVIIYTSY